MSETNPEYEAEAKLTLYRGWLDRGKHVWSPFVIKVEARLRFAGISYTTEAGSTTNAPKGKIPYIQVESRGQVTTLGDSTFIIKHLIERDILPNINSEIEPTTQAQDLALRALLEDRLYFYHTWERWIENYYAMREYILSALPYPIRVGVGLLIYRNTTRTLYGQGTSRYTADEIKSFRREIWESINALVISAQKATTMKASGDESRPFWILQGEHPTEADATLFGFIVSVLICTACPDSQSLVKEFPAILEYAGRIHDQYFPDYLKWEE